MLEKKSENIEKDIDKVTPSAPYIHSESFEKDKCWLGERTADT